MENKSFVHQSILHSKNLTHHNIFLCYFNNHELKMVNLTMPNRLAKSTKNNNLYSTQNIAKFEKFKMSNIQCEFSIDENYARKMLISVDWFLEPFNFAILVLIILFLLLVFFASKKIGEKKVMTKILLSQMDIKQVSDNSCSTSVSDKQQIDGLEPVYLCKLSPSNFKRKILRRNAKFKFENGYIHMKVLSDTNSHQCKNLKSKSFDLLRTIYQTRHDNLNSFKGFFRPTSYLPTSDLSFEIKNCSFVWQYNSRGSLFEIIHNHDIELDWFFKISLLIDLINGMNYLHYNTNLGKHGFLTSKNCVVDSKWLLKITDFGFYEFHRLQDIKPDPLPLQEYLWSAPELLKLGFEQCLINGTRESDVYSFGLIMKELIKREIPFNDQPNDNQFSQLISNISSGVIKAENYLKFDDFSIPEYVYEIMVHCVSFLPSNRMNFIEIQNIVQKIDKSYGKSGKSNIVDNMILKLEKYSTNLEEIVAEKTLQLEKEMAKSDELLNRILPVSVARNLRNGIRVKPEKYNDVTVYFSDIVGFTTISIYSGPMEIIELLNQLYSAFDAIIDKHKVYKVETIGDAYMCVSGLPDACEDSASQICNMALEILYYCQGFIIPHMPSVPLRVRCGIHTGSVVAGVVGRTMPRYSIFGDTVNTASRMESTGRPQRIQISSSTYRKIAPLGIYDLQRRGNVNLNGRGSECTYWLNGKLNSEQRLPEVLVGEDLIDEGHGFHGKELDIFQSMKRNYKDNLN